MPAFREQGSLIWPGSCTPPWGLSPSRGPQLHSPASLSALHQTRAPLLILALPAAACAKRCNLPPAREVTAEEASRPLALLCRYKKPFKGPLCEPQLSLQHERREAAESREHIALGLPFKLPNQIPTPQKPVSSLTGERLEQAWGTGYSPCVPLAAQVEEQCNEDPS